MITEELKQVLADEGYKHMKEVPGRGVCGVMKFMFTYGLVYGIDMMGYKGRWCFGSELEAVYALEIWTGAGDPKGRWIKFKGEGGERSPVDNSAHSFTEGSDV
jgi:hypothetical protein